MGVGVMVGATLLGGYLQGRQAQQQARAQAAQAEANAQMAYNNAQRMEEQALETSKNNAINEENKRRRILVQQGQQRANIGAAGIQMTGSAADALADSAFNASQELAIDRYNARQEVDKLYQQSTDYVNQGDIYSANAKSYRKAGKRAMMNSMLQAGVSLATNLYAANSVGKLKTAASAAGGGWTSYSGLEVANSGFTGGTAASLTGSTVSNGKLITAGNFGSNGWVYYK